MNIRRWRGALKMDLCAIPVPSAFTPKPHPRRLTSRGHVTKTLFHGATPHGAVPHPAFGVVRRRAEMLS